MTAVTIVTVAISLSSCSGILPYEHFTTVGRQGWSADSALVFVVTGADTTRHYDAEIHVRHTQQYPYQNLWLFVEQDTIQLYLADQRGRWIGRRSGGYYETYVVWREDMPITSDTLRIGVVQAMREDTLVGITDIGLILREHGKK